MGKASSSKKVARAARAAGRPGGGRNLGWPLLMTSVVIVGVVLIVLSRGGTVDAGAPRLGDHWHAAYGIYNCDQFLPAASDSMSVQPSVHTHGDGLIHIEPTSTRYTGTAANLGAFASGASVKLSDTSFTAGGVTRRNGAKCGGRSGTVQVKVWDGVSDSTGRILSSDVDSFAPKNGTLVTIAFVAKGAEIPKPPADALAALGQQDVAPTDDSTVPPGTSEITVPPSGSTETTEATETTASSTSSTTGSSTPSTTTSPTTAP